jgi:hypothetical protein
LIPKLLNADSPILLEVRGILTRHSIDLAAATFLAQVASRLKGVEFVGV